MSTAHLHPDTSRPITSLRCGLCNAGLIGRSYEGQPSGTGLCNDCVPEAKTAGTLDQFGVDGVHFRLDPIAKVLDVRTEGRQARWTNWRITQNLTDRWGDINTADAVNKPLDELEADPDLLQSLRLQMYGEDTFVVRKDGRFGILVEIEFTSQKSENDPKLLPHDIVVTKLVNGMAEICPDFPEVEFAVPNPDEIFMNRPAVWAFVPSGALNNDQMERLVTRLRSI